MFVGIGCGAIFVRINCHFCIEKYVGVNFMCEDILLQCKCILSNPDWGCCQVDLGSGPMLGLGKTGCKFRSLRYSRLGNTLRMLARLIVRRLG